MAGGPPSIKEEIEMSMSEELDPRSQRKSQEHLIIEEMMDHGSRSSGASQRRHKSEPKAAGSAATQPARTTTATRAKKAGSQLPRMLREADHGEAHVSEYPGSFQSMQFPYESNPEGDVIAEIGLEGLSVLEMEVMRRQGHTGLPKGQNSCFLF
ncbi:fetal and adult testis-expressed transcript protein isoform X2 [Tupaia chinensis]|uniref:fetal and adult testis-expressed transcript protein isoform X2 n=1 Tax=Tupaia chinensis TaxID=246437 RepID=UPI0003C8D735|nr:fetal and adult testis-expressed transcript protein isoform X2 [Tupaia chinensis]